MKRQVEFVVEASTWAGASKSVPSVLQGLAGSQSVDMLDVSLMIALYTAPPQGYGWDLSYFWAVLRYLPAISSARTLSLRKAWDQVDSHQKTIMSDDMGMGFGAWVADAALPRGVLVGTDHFIEILSANGIVGVEPRRRSKRGPSKAPDFMHVRCGSNVVDVIECKGTQTPKSLSAALDRAVEQKSNLKPRPTSAISIGETLGVGIAFDLEGREPARCVVVDPPEDVWIPAMSRDELWTMLARYEYARASTLMGHPAIRDFFWRREAPQSPAREEAGRRVRETRPSLDGRLEGRRTLIDLPTPLLPSDDDVAKGEVTALEARVEVMQADLEGVASGLSADQIVERSLSRVTAGPPRGVRDEAERTRTVQTPLGVTVSIRPLERGERNQYPG